MFGLQSAKLSFLFSAGPAGRRQLLNSLLVGSILLHMHDYPLIVGFGPHLGLLGSQPLDQAVQHLQLLVLLCYPDRQSLPLFLVEHRVFLVLLDVLLVPEHGLLVVLLHLLELPQDVVDLLPQLLVLALDSSCALVVAGVFDVLVDNSFDLDDPLHNFLHLHRPINVHWLHLNISADLLQSFRLSLEILVFLCQLFYLLHIDGLNLVCVILIGPQYFLLLFQFFLEFLQHLLQLFVLSGLGLQRGFDFFHFLYHKRVPALKLFNLVLQHLILALDLADRLLRLQSQPLLEFSKLLLMKLLPVPEPLVHLSPEAADGLISFGYLRVVLLGALLQDLFFLGKHLDLRLKADDARDEVLHFDILLVDELVVCLLLLAELLLLNRRASTMMAAHSAQMLSLRVWMSTLTCFCRHKYFYFHISRSSSSCSSRSILVPQWHSHRLWLMNLTDFQIIINGPCTIIDNRCMNRPNKVKEIITNAKSIPLPVYHLLFINLVLFGGLVLRDLSALYILGCLVFVLMATAVAGRVTKLWEAPAQLISAPVLEVVHERLGAVSAYLDKLAVSQLVEDKTHTLVSVLVVAYFGSLFNATLQIILGFNVLFSSIFLPNEFAQITGLAQEALGKFSGFITYKNRQ